MYRKRKINGTEIRTGRIQEAMARYCLGRDKMRSVAKEAGAVIKLGGVCLYDFEKLDNYFKTIGGAS